jgi:hypothetical protein
MLASLVIVADSLSALQSPPLSLVILCYVLGWTKSTRTVPVVGWTCACTIVASFFGWRSMALIAILQPPITVRTGNVSTYRYSTVV